MFSKIKDRREEETLLEFVKEQARYNKELIAELEVFEDVKKANGEIHKGKQKARLKLIKDLKLELKKMKAFYIDHSIDPGIFDYHRYQYSRKISDNRSHLYGQEKNKN